MTHLHYVSWIARFQVCLKELLSQGIAVTPYIVQCCVTQLGCWTDLAVVPCFVTHNM